MRGKYRELAFVTAFALLAIALLLVAGRALRPARVDYGAVWDPYLAEAEHSLDYLYLGSSYAYCDVDPAAVYRESGLNGHVLAGPEQTLSITYYYLKEALKTQHPAAVVLEGSALHFAPYQSYTQVNVGYMPLSPVKLEAIFTAAEPALRPGLLFELYFYHSRWKDVTPQEVLSALTPPKADRLRGFTAVDGVFAEIAEGPFPRTAQPEEVYLQNVAWLERIAGLCRREEIPLVVVAHPTYSRLSQEDYRRMDSDLTALGVPFYDWSGAVEEFGLVPEEHFYDPGHLNRAGAEIFSAGVARFLTGELALTPSALTAP